MPETTRRPALIRRSTRLARILDNGYASLSCDRHNFVHLCRLPEQMNSNDRFGRRSQLCLYARRIYIACDRINIGKYRGRPDARNRLRRGDKCKWRCDYLIAGTNTAGVERQYKRIRSIGYADGVRRSQQSGYLRFELLDLRPENISAAVQCFLDAGHNFVL